MGEKIGKKFGEKKINKNFYLNFIFIIHILKYK